MAIKNFGNLVADGSGYGLELRVLALDDICGACSVDYVKLCRNFEFDSNFQESMS